MSPIEIFFRLLILLQFRTNIHMLLLDPSEDNQRIESIIREENTRARFTCDLSDVAWWKRPHLLATRYGMILTKYRGQMTLEKLDDGTQTSGIQLHVLNIDHLRSNDSGIYECETLGALRQFNLTVTGMFNENVSLMCCFSMVDCKKILILSCSFFYTMTFVGI